MKFFLPIIICTFAACSTLTPEQNDSLWTLGSQVATIGAAAVGVNVTPAEIDGVAAVLRSLAGAKKPTTQEIKVAIASGTGSPESAKKLEVLAPIIQQALNSAPTDAVIEKAAIKLNQVAAQNR